MPRFLGVIYVSCNTLTMQKKIDKGVLFWA